MVKTRKREGAMRAVMGADYKGSNRYLDKNLMEVVQLPWKYLEEKGFKVEGKVCAQIVQECLKRRALWLQR